MLRTLYDPIALGRSGRLQVSEVHNLYWEESGNPQGTPVVYVHGGPGGGCANWQRQYFDPQRFRIVLFDQRGCGRSTPHADLSDNTTWHLVADMEALRTLLGIDTWLVFGGSWGSTLALAYAQTHPERVRGLILRGIFLLRHKELQWFYQEGASWIFPDAWAPYLAHIPEAERADLIGAYHRRLTDPDRAVQVAAARAWSIWEGSTSRLIPDPDLVDHYGEDDFALAFARIECQYFVNKAWMRDGQLLEDVDRIRHIPAVIVQGRYDVVCPMRSAWDLHQAWPEARLEIVADAGHASIEPGIVDCLIRGVEDLAG